MKTEKYSCKGMGYDRVLEKRDETKKYIDSLPVFSILTLIFDP